MAKKKNNKRKVVAVALGLVGIAGLSLASAAQLQVDTENEVAIGTGEFGACQGNTPVSVDYDYDLVNGTYEIQDLTVSGIVATCAHEPIAVALADEGENELFSGNGTVGAAGGSVDFDLAAEGIDIALDLGDVTVIIG